jgi:hypothetical protein
MISEYFEVLYLIWATICSTQSRSFSAVTDLWFRWLTVALHMVSLTIKSLKIRSLEGAVS